MNEAPAAQLIAALRDARARTVTLLGDLRGDELMGPRLDIVNPPLWELGHVAWFQEYWAWRHLRGLPPLRADGDRLYDSAKVAHDTRWELELPSFEQTLSDAQTILERIVERLAAGEPSRDCTYFHRLALFHEDMHGEAFAYTRQTLGYRAPAIETLSATGSVSRADADAGGGAANGDAVVPGGTFVLGATRDTAFVFDNEKWAHAVELAPFRISRTAVSNAEFAAFVDDDGYSRRELWSEQGWEWRERAGARHPIYWRRTSQHDWQQRVFDRWRSLPLDHPVIHVCWFEADAYCRWARRRLPSEAEWEGAASAEPARGRQALGTARRIHPWGDEPATPAHANLDGWHMDTIPVDWLARGDSAFSCRQMFGNVWEWTATDFGPYPGFTPDPYKEYSQPWFGDHKVLRGGCWATRARLLRNTFRNFYKPDRRDVFAGFRTCAID